MTKILFTLGWTGRKGSLNFLPTYELVRGISAIGEDAHLLVSDRAELPELEREESSDKWLRRVPHDYRTAFGFSRNMSNFLNVNEDYDIYHTNGLSTYVNHLTCTTARRRKRPYLITPYGMLSDYRSRSMADRLLHRVFFSNDVRHASCLRAISMEEGQQFRRLGLENPIACIPWPNYVPLFIDKAVEQGQDYRRKHPDSRRIATVLVNDNDDSLPKVLDAFAAVAGEKDELIVFNCGYVRSTDAARRLISDRRMENVRICEGMADYDNTVVLASCSATVLPANHIFVGPVIARSLLCLTPVIVACDPEWEEVPAMNCGWWCPPDGHHMERLISAALMMDNELLNKKGLNGRKLILSTYDTRVVAAKMLRLYDWLLGKCGKPDFVI